MKKLLAVGLVWCSFLAGVAYSVVNPALVGEVQVVNLEMPLRNVKTMDWVR